MILYLTSFIQLKVIHDRLFESNVSRQIQLIKNLRKTAVVNFHTHDTLSNLGLNSRTNGNLFLIIMRYLFPVKTFLLIASLKQIYKYLNSIKIVLSFQSRKYRKLINAWFTQTFLNRENALAMERLVENSIFGRTRRERFVTVLSTMGSAFFYFSYT